MHTVVSVKKPMAAIRTDPSLRETDSSLRSE